MPFVIVIIAVIIGVVATVVKETVKAKKKAEAEAAMKKFDEKEELKKYVEKPAQPAAQRPQSARPQTATAQTQSQSTKARLEARYQQLQRVASEIQSMGHHDEDHCAVKHESSAKYRVEKVPVMNSIGGKSTEGCADHYDLRFVKLDEEEKPVRELTDLQKIIVYGEVFNKPAFKRNYRR